MKLRSMAVAAALGATVLTTVPVVTAPFTAYASCVDDHSTCGNEDPPPPEDPDDQDPPIIDFPDPGYPDYPGDDPGPATGSLPTVITNGSNVSEAPVPVADATLPTVVVTGTATPAPAPADPAIPGNTGAVGGGGEDSTPGAVLYRLGKLWEKHENCYRNGNSMPYKVSETVKYDVTYQVSTNISAKAVDVLTATIGTQLNTTISRSQTVDFTLNPGESWSLFVEYQTNVYRITTFDYWSLSYKTEFVNVTAPTGVVTPRPC
ncbi:MULTISPECIES: DUF6426 family protein [unclassified Kitasatospora]|uniref:DUF6426 family protein n=1 Tax=unclassified Kitasatospora TaxID=2633591 RepID=UPI0038250DF9